jgi:hypothetical protein
VGSLKSFRRKEEKPKQPPDDPANPTVSFHGEQRSNQTHQSTTDLEALLARNGKGKEAKLYYSANALGENRNFLLVDFQVEPADGHTERRAAIAMADERVPGTCRITLAGDQGLRYSRLRCMVSGTRDHFSRRAESGAARRLGP